MQESALRPWGSYTVLHEQEASHKVKLIEVHPGSGCRCSRISTGRSTGLS